MDARRVGHEDGAVEEVLRRRDAEPPLPQRLRAEVDREIVRRHQWQRDVVGDGEGLGDIVARAVQQHF